jgi:hypothetical protein
MRVGKKWPCKPAVKKLSIGGLVSFLFLCYPIIERAGGQRESAEAQEVEGSANISFALFLLTMSLPCTFI